MKGTGEFNLLIGSTADHVDTESAVAAFSCCAEVDQADGVGRHRVVVLAVAFHLAGEDLLEDVDHVGGEPGWILNLVVLDLAEGDFHRVFVVAPDLNRFGEVHLRNAVADHDHLERAAVLIDGLQAEAVVAFHGVAIDDVGLGVAVELHTDDQVGVLVLAVGIVASVGEDLQVLRDLLAGRVIGLVVDVVVVVRRIAIGRVVTAAVAARRIG